MYRIIQEKHHPNISWHRNVCGKMQSKRIQQIKLKRVFISSEFVIEVTGDPKKTFPLALLSYRWEIAETKME